MTTIQGQQLLDLFDHSCDFNNFIALANELTIANLQSFSSQYTHIFGNHLCGKSYLLKAWVNLANKKYQSAIYLDAQQIDNGAIAQINLDNFRFIAIDNIDILNEDQQIELFDLFNHIKLNNRDNYLLTSSSKNLNHCELRIDLKTRILSGLVFALKSLNEEELLSALLIYTKREGIRFEESELKYLLSHYTRNLGELMGLIDKVANFALTEKKQITLPLIKTVCNH